ncbi:unannotated protein [freshwater metagenome]|uniref:Unannotated protein n=1 Tax=freshwater metagenome TaxID=449393 RepID=A0A6J7QRJ8_9ZZZZ
MANNDSIAAKIPSLVGTPAGMLPEVWITPSRNTIFAMGF